MPIYLLSDDLLFPDPEKADESGILAVGGDLSIARLLTAYSQGIFPWYDERTAPILWHSPPWRMVLWPHELYVSRSLRKTLRRERFEVRYNTAFAEVLEQCAKVPRPGQIGTWLNREMQRAYLELHARGHAHSAEAWLDGRLVGGLYGVTMGTAFFGESMFALETDASKVAFVHAVRQLEALGYSLVDCQVYTEHLASFGAAEIPRRDFLAALARTLAREPRAVWP